MRLNNILYAMAGSLGRRGLCLGLLVCGTAAFAQTNVVDEVVWVVGDEAILLSDVENQRLLGDKVNGNPYCVIPEQMAIQKLFLHQAAIDSIDVGDNEISQRVDAKIDEWVMMAGSKEKLEEYRNMTITQLREELKGQFRDMLTTQKMRRHLVSDIKVTPSEVRRYYNDMPEDSMPLIPTQVEVQIVVFQPVVPQEETERVKAELREYAERINSGNASFSSLATLYSEDPGTARQGGMMDYVGRGMLDPAFANVAFSLNDPSKVSKIVESEYGFHIIQLIDKRGDKIKVRHILRRPKLDQALIDEQLSRLDSLAEDIRQGKLSFEEAARWASDDKDTRNNHGIMTNVKIDEMTDEYVRTSRFEMKELPAEVARAVETLQTSEISAPFMMINSKGKEVCAIVKLKTRIKQHRANMAEDFQVLKNIVLEKRQDEFIDKWIREKQRTTYVRINENWCDCEFQYPGWVKK